MVRSPGATRNLRVGVIGISASLKRIPIDHQVRVLAHPFPDTVSKGEKKELRSLSASEFHRRNEIAVSGDEHNNLGLPLQCQTGDIQAYPHVHALLANDWLEVARFDCDGRARLVQHPGV